MLDFPIESLLRWNPWVFPRVWSNQPLWGQEDNRGKKHPSRGVPDNGHTYSELNLFTSEGTKGFEPHNPLPKMKSTDNFLWCKLAIDFLFSKG